MIDIQYDITLLEYWQSSSGLGQGALADSECIKDNDGLPYIPGKTIKGLWRDAVCMLATYDHDIEDSVVDDLFGAEASEIDGTATASRPGQAHWSSAMLPFHTATAISDAHISAELYSTVSSTAINRQGVAKDHSLRSAEVCMPLTLQGSVSVVDSHAEQVTALLTKAAPLLRRVGMSRHRGMGRCLVTIKSTIHAQ